jgi:hypothetical protein
MPTTLTYSPLPDGYRWNLLQRINLKTGYWPGTSTTSSYTYIKFIEDLTQQEIDDVNAIVGDGTTCQDPVKFASQNNRIIIKDVWEWRDQLEADAGFNVAITYQVSGLKGTNPDEIVLQATDSTYQAEKILKANERNAFMSAVEGLNRIE